MREMRTLLLDTTDSTNDHAKRLLAADGACGWGCVLAREQTAGRGTHGRAWHSPRDAGVYMTVCYAPAAGLPTTPDYALAGAAACCEVIAEECGVDARLKLPNDLVVGARKLGGVLTESMVEDGITVALLVGIGINVHPVDLPATTNAAGVTATSLEDEADPQRFRALDRGRFVDALAQRVAEFVERVARGEREEVQRAAARFRLV